MTTTQHDTTVAPVTETLTIEGMSCGHCVGAVRRELATLDGVDVEHVAVGEARLRRDPARTSREAVDAAIEEAGFAPRR